jgi:hypothetical protein
LVSKPTGPVVPSLAKLVLGGGDDATPLDLLRFEVTVDGAPRPASSLRQIMVGAPGVTATHHVVARAVDMAGNVDPSPVIADVLVDGVAPRVLILGDAAARVPAGAVSLEIYAHDDVTPDAQLGAFIDIRRYRDPTNMLTAESVATATVRAGERQATLSLDPGVYQVAVNVTDAAGNTLPSTVIALAVLALLGLRRSKR